APASATCRPCRPRPPRAPAPSDAPAPRARRRQRRTAPPTTPGSMPRPAPPARLELSVHARKALEHFDAAGRLVRWPLKLSVQRLAMWVLWTRFDTRRAYTEAAGKHVL